MNINITKTNKYIKSFRTEKIIGMFDLQPEHQTQQFNCNIDIDYNWNIGIIVGRSGTGKSTIAKEISNIYNPTYNDRPVIDEMPEDTVENITKTFAQVGFSSPPSWLKPYGVLSNGEKMRVDLAKALLSKDKLIVYDEFTSVVDRDVAKICSTVIQKNIRKQNKKFIAVTCHYDVTEYLQPDWILNTDDMSFIKCDVKKNNIQSTLLKENMNTGDILETIII